MTSPLEPPRYYLLAAGSCRIVYGPHNRFEIEQLHAFYPALELVDNLELLERQSAASVGGVLPRKLEHSQDEGRG